MTKHIEGEDRNEAIMFPEILDDYVATEAQVRFIDAFVNRIDLQTLEFSNAVTKPTGRPPYNPADLLKLYLYGYLNRVRSSRQLERESWRNIEVLWLLRKLHPDFKTIADFRKDNGQAIRNVCRIFTLLCRNIGLFGGEIIAIDGSKFKACNSKKRNFTRSKLDRLIKETDKKIDEYLVQLDEEDSKEKDVKSPTTEQLQKKIEWMKENLKKYLGLQKQMKSTGQTQVSLTDPDSRAMYLGQAIQISYNVQTAVDAKCKLIVDHEVTNSVTDLGQLSPLALRVKDFLGVPGFELLADRGYYFGEQIKTCLDAGITPYIPKPKTSTNLKRKMFSKDDFTYLTQENAYRCPAGKLLTHRFRTMERGRDIHYYMASDCNTCSLKLRCTRTKYRRLTRLNDEAVLDDMAARIIANPDKVDLRKTLAEHPFGTLKRTMDQGYFLLKGIKKVSSEMSLSVLAYNMKRVFTLLGVAAMIAALR
jgi:transposase